MLWKKETKEPQPFRHSIQKGDHLIRWTQILLWPVQVHAICIACNDESVTLVDFGLAATKQKKNESDWQSSDNDEELEDNNQELLEAAAAEQHAQHERMNILTLTEEKDLRHWRKVEYGKTFKEGPWKNWWKKKKDESEVLEEGKEVSKEETEPEKHKTSNKDIDEEDSKPPPAWQFWKKHESSESNADETETRREEDEETGPTQTEPPARQQGTTECHNDNTEEEEPKTTATPPPPPSLPNSDPTNLVLARVRYLLTHPEVLPPHNVFHSNSECIAVWCQTGRWSTLQASIFLHSTAAGNLKSAVTLAATAATATTTTTTTASVPAWGIAGWLGFTTTTTTTTTVGFLSLHPWLIPVLAGYGLVAVGTPIVMLQQAKKRWEQVTQSLTDGFWEWADADVYVEVIQSWSGLGVDASEDTNTAAVVR